MELLPSGESPTAGRTRRRTERIGGTSSRTVSCLPRGTQGMPVHHAALVDSVWGSDNALELAAAAGSPLPVLCLSSPSVAPAVFNLFSSRPRSTDNAQFRQKLPDFVRRLEEALYRTAATKVSSPSCLQQQKTVACLLPCTLMRPAPTRMRCSLQEEYIDESTVEMRLQNVARRMVSTTPRRSEGERPASSGPQQNGGPPADAAAVAFGGSGLGRGFSGASGLLGQGLNAPQEHSLPAGSQGLPPASAGPLGMSAGPSSQYMQHPGMQMQLPGSMGGSRLMPGQEVPGMGPLLGSGQMKVDSPGGGGMPMGPMGGYPLNSGHPSYLRGQGGAPGTGPVMSNGAPVLLRSSRDWVPGQSPSVLNVRSFTFRSCLSPQLISPAGQYRDGCACLLQCCTCTDVLAAVT